jgi:hypothetical protein
VSWINAQLAGLAWKGHKSGLSGEDGFFSTHHINMEGIHSNS